MSSGPEPVEGLPPRRRYFILYLFFVYFVVHFRALRDSLS